MHRCFVGLLLMAMLGCGNSGPVKYRLSGAVNLDGTPLADGIIHFKATDAQVPDEMAQVRSGKYEIQVAPGERLVQITAERIVPGKKDALNMPLREQFVPEKYNADSKRKIVVTGNQVENFDLRSE
jgi:hypothetical protein